MKVIRIIRVSSKAFFKAFCQTLVAPHLIVNTLTPPFNELLDLVRNPASSLRRRPGRRWNFKSKQLMNTPLMISNAGCHSRSPRKPFVTSNQSWNTQTIMAGAEVVDCSYQIHTIMQRVCSASQNSTFSNQRCQAASKCSIKPFNKGCVDYSFSLRALDSLFYFFSCPLNNPTAYFPNSAFAVLFNDLCEQQTRPCLKSWASFFACKHWLTEDQPDSCQIGCKTIGANVNRACCTKRMRGSNNPFLSDII